MSALRHRGDEQSVFRGKCGLERGFGVIFGAANDRRSREAFFSFIRKRFSPFLFVCSTSTPNGHAEGIDTAPTGPVIRLNYYATKGVIASRPPCRSAIRYHFFLHGHSTVLHLNFNRFALHLRAEPNGMPQSGWAKLRNTPHSYRVAFQLKNSDLDSILATSFSRKLLITRHTSAWTVTYAI